MKEQIFSALLIIIFLCTCKNKHQIQKIDNFPEAIKLTGERVFEKHAALATVQHFDSLIVLTTGMKNFFHVFNSDREHLSSFGRAGRGPGEFLEKPFINDIYQHNSTPNVLVYDPNLKKAVDINLAASISEDELIIQKRPKLPPKLHKSSLIEYFPIKENYYVGMYEDRFYNQIDQQRNGFYYDAVNDKFTIFPLKNLEMEPYKRIPEANLNNRSMRISPDRSKLAFAMMFYPMVEIFEVGSDNPVQYLINANPSEGPFKLSEYREGKLNQYFIGLYVSDKYLYLLGSQKVRDQNLDSMQEIYVLDWEGNPKKKYLLPNKYDLNSITIDEKNGRIYGISFKHDEAYMFDHGKIK